MQKVSEIVNMHKLKKYFQKLRSNEFESKKRDSKKLGCYFVLAPEGRIIVRNRWNRLTTNWG